MHFILSTQEFTYLVTKIQSIVAPKPATPLLANFLLVAEANQITLTATDLTTIIQCQAEAKVIKEGKTTLPMKTVAALLRTLTAANLEISTNEQQITEIIAGPSHFKIHGMPTGQFPSLPSLEGANRLTLSCAEFREALYRTAFAVSREDSRYVLTGILLSLKNGQAILVGTDAKRLARYPISLPSSFEETGEYVIPIKAVDEMLRNLHEDNESVTLYFMPDKLGVQMGPVTLITKLLSGEYPDVEQVIPQQVAQQIPVHREELITLLRQISLFTADTAQSVQFQFVNGELKLASNATDVGEGKVWMPVSYKGPEIKAAFNPRFMRDILEHSEKERVILGIDNAHNPAVICDEEEDAAKEKQTPLFVLMPMRLNE